MLTNTRTSEIHRSADIHWWPSALGIAFALSVGLFVGEGFPAVVFVCAVVYVFAAVVARPGIAWLGYLLSVPLVGIGPAIDLEWLSLAVLGVLTIVLIVIGLARGTWSRKRNRLQLIGIAVFGALAALGLVVDVRIAGVAIAAGLLGHAAWDVVHHQRNEVVSRSYAEFCAVLDLVLAVLVIESVVVSG